MTTSQAALTSRRFDYFIPLLFQFFLDFFTSAEEGGNESVCLFVGLLKSSERILVIFWRDRGGPNTKWLVANRILSWVLDHFPRFFATSRYQSINQSINNVFVLYSAEALRVSKALDRCQIGRKVTFCIVSQKVMNVFRWIFCRGGTRAKDHLVIRLRSGEFGNGWIRIWIVIRKWKID